MDLTSSGEHIQAATNIFCGLVGEVSEKYEAMEALDHPDQIDLPALRTF